MPAFLYIIWTIVQLIVGFNLVFPLMLYIIYISRKVLLLKKTVPHTQKQEADYAIIVTAYEQTHTLPDVVNSLLQLHYHNYLIYVVADNCDVANLQFNNEKTVLLRPEETLANNIKSHFYAINRFKRPHERLTIIDSDNLTHPDYLNNLNKMFDKGFEAVQGERKAKNLNTTFACLDAARDLYYHFYDGKILFGAGSSATLSGSGMAFTVDLYKECLQQLNISGAGFDKVLQKEIIIRKKRIAFTGNAIVYDEKTTHTDQLVKQRARWINTWFKYFSYGFTLIARGIININWNQFLFGLVLLRPPLFVFLLLSIIFMCVNIIVSPVIALYWLAAMGLFVAGFIWALMRSETDKRIYASLINIPRFIFYQVVSLTKAKKANKLSVATKHHYTTEQKQ